MSYHHHQSGDNYGTPQGASYDSQSSPHSRSPQAVQVGSVPRNSRSVSSNRTTAPAQTQPINPYEVGQQSWESDPRYVHVSSTPAQPYIGSQGQLRNPSIRDSAYHLPVEQQFRPSDYSPPHVAVGQNQPHSPTSQQPSTPYGVPYSVQAQPQFDISGHISRGPQQQQFSTYHQQPQNPVSEYQQSSVPQYHDPQNPPPSSGYQRKPEPSPSGYPRNPGPSPSGYPMTHALPSETTTTSDVRHKRRDSSTSRDSRGPTGPTCRLPGCNRPVTMDMNTHELSEYCSKEHIQEDLQRGAPPCPACKRSPCRLNSNYCGSACERYAAQQRQQQHLKDSTSTRSPQEQVPPSGSDDRGGYQEFQFQFKRSRRLSAHSSRPLPFPGNVRCPRCGHIYRAPGRSVNRPDMLSDNPIGLSSLPRCPSCGFYQP